MALTIPEEQDLDTARELAQWLEESGRRKRSPAWMASLHTRAQEHACESAVPVPPPARMTWHLPQAPLLCLFGMAAFSYLLYYFVGVTLQTLSLRSLIVFVTG